ncbi:MAG TPA: hypothetical protein VJ650_11555 [Gemmatimonadaceae bacterium]|nr:hypothetical protein [Gemmatimonadaceae bacterium]
MRRGTGWGSSCSRGIVLLVLWACGGRLRVPETDRIGEPECSLTEAPVTAADSATIVLDALGVTREACALSIVAETLRPWPHASSGPWTVQLTVSPAHVTARPISGERARDVIDRGSTLMATDDVDLLAYAASREDLQVTPLAWDRTYLHLSPTDAGVLAAGADPDAVRVDARRAEPDRCDALPVPAGSPTSPRAMRIVYDAADRVARELAERTVALAEHGDVTAVGLRGADFDAALTRGDHLAYIVALPRSSYCDALAELSRRAPWLTSAAIVPLIDTRAHAIAPRASQP